MSSSLRLVRLRRQDSRTPPVTGPVAAFPGVPVAPVSLSPDPVPSPTVAPGHSDAVTNLTGVTSAQLTMTIAGGTNHAFQATHALPLVEVDATLRNAKMNNCWALNVALTVWDAAAGAEVVLPTAPVGCLLHPTGCP